MSTKRMNYSVLVAIVVLLLSPLVITTKGGQENEQMTRAGDYVQFGDYGLGSHQIGETVEFRITVSNTYQGQHWTGQNPYNHDDLYRVKLTLLYNELRMSNGDPAPGGVISPTSTSSMRAYNGPDSEGYDITYSRTYYSSEDSDSFEFKIETTGIKSGTYEIPLEISAEVHFDVSSTDPSGYSWLTVEESGYVSFTIRSNIGNVGQEIPLEPYESGSVPLYAGAKYMTLQTPYIYPVGTAIEELEIELSLPVEHFTTPVYTYSLENLNGYYTPTFKAGVQESTPPGFYTGSLTYSYTRFDERYIEGPYDAKLEVEDTPLLSPPDTKEMSEPTVIAEQKTETLKFEFDMVNKGNVDLEEFLVRLDLDSSSFLSQLEYYYDEDDHSNKVYAPLEFTAEDVEVGDVVRVEFPDVSVYGMLPPGDYLIPIDYKLTYRDPSVEGGAAPRLNSYQWDELYRNDFLDIMYYRNDPRPTELKKPHFMLRVLDDKDGADLKLDCTRTFNSGDKNVNAQFSLTNKEFYSVNNADIEIRSSDNSVVWSSVSTGDRGLLATAEDVTIPSSNFGNPGIYSLSGQLDISGSCPTGAFDVEMIVRGVDDVGNPVQINRTDSIDIKAEAGKLSVASIETDDVEPGKDFKLRANLINSGDVSISDYQVMLKCSDNMICVLTPNASGSTLAPGETAQVEFECRAAKSMDYEKESQMFLLTKVNDEEGNMKDFTDDEGLALNINAAREPDELKTQDALRSLGVYFLLAVIIGTILFCLAMILSVGLYVFRDRITGMGSEREKNKHKEDEEKQEEPKKAKDLKAPQQISTPSQEQRTEMQQAPPPQQIPQQQPAQQFQQQQQPNVQTQNPPFQSPQEQKPMTPHNLPGSDSSDLDDIFA